MTTWQPIDTAPKDGSPILAWLPDEEQHYAVVTWTGAIWARAGDDYDLFAEPTHWMPLPEPPEAEGHNN